jgi:aromatic-L-amino-acid decarboxylase
MWTPHTEEAFQLTARGSERLAGIERADSIAVDPHKSLFVQYGTGVLLVRDPIALQAAHSGGGDYLQDLGTTAGLPDYGHVGPELTREFRGLRLWLPLHLHGVAAFRAALDEKLDLADLAYRQLAMDARFEVPGPPDLTVVIFRLRGDDEPNRRLLERINGTGRIFLSTTRVEGRYFLRLNPTSHRTHATHVHEAIALIRDSADVVQGIADGAPP